MQRWKFLGMRLTLVIPKVQIIPYCEVDGIATFTNSEILGFYDQMVRIGVADTVFSDGQINSREEWLRTAKQPENFLFIVYVGEEVVGVAWLNRVEAKKARFHYCMFYNGWKKGSVEIGRQVLEILTSKKTPKGEYLFDMLTGLTPSSNKRAIRYMKKCNWKVVGEMPFGTWNHSTQESEPAIVSYYVREAV